MEEEAGECSGCGLPLDETTAEEHARDWLAGVPIPCHACQTRQRTIDAFRENAKNTGAMTAGLLWPVTRRADSDVS